MARKTPEELLEAKRQRRQREEQAEMERDKEWERVRALKDEHAQLQSFVDGIYEELSKLSVKWPTQPVSKLTLDQTNRAIQQLKKLMAEEQDLFVDDINELIPAGDLPEARDVVLVLRQVKQTLDRLKAKYRRTWQDY